MSQCSCERAELHPAQFPVDLRYIVAAIAVMQGAVSQLSQEVIHLEERRQMLYSEDIPALTEDIARLNDTYIVAVCQRRSYLLCLAAICAPMSCAGNRLMFQSAGTELT